MQLQLFNDFRRVQDQKGWDKAGECRINRRLQGTVTVGRLVLCAP